MPGDNPGWGNAGQGEQEEVPEDPPRLTSSWEHFTRPWNDEPRAAFLPKSYGREPGSSLHLGRRENNPFLRVLNNTDVSGTRRGPASFLASSTPAQCPSVTAAVAQVPDS